MADNPGRSGGALMHLRMDLRQEVFGLIVVALALSACSKPSATQGAAPRPVAPMVKMTVAYSEITFINLPLWTAKADGIFEKHGLDVDLQNIDSSTSIAALVSGQVQAAAAGGSEALSAAVEGADLQTVACLGGQYPYVLMAPASIQTPDDLRGKKVGVSRAGSSSDIATRVVLKRLGLDPDNDVTIIAVGSLANRTAALLSGSIDAGLDSPPGSLKEEAQGLHVLVHIASLK